MTTHPQPLDRLANGATVVSYTHKADLVPGDFAAHGVVLAITGSEYAVWNAYSHNPDSGEPWLCDSGDYSFSFIRATETYMRRAGLNTD